MKQTNTTQMLIFMTYCNIQEHVHRGKVPNAALLRTIEQARVKTGAITSIRGNPKIVIQCTGNSLRQVTNTYAEQLC